RRDERRELAQGGGGPLGGSVHGLQQPRAARLELQASARARWRLGDHRRRRLATEGALHHRDRQRDPDVRPGLRPSPGLMSASLTGAASVRRSSLEIPLDTVHILTARLYAGGVARSL